MDWRTVYASVTGSAPPFTYPPELIGSLVFFAAVYLFATVLRSVNYHVLQPGLPQYAVDDFISTFQTCAMSMENIHIFNHYGYPGLSLALFLETYLYLATYGNSQSSPTGNFQQWWSGCLPLSDAVFMIALQAFAAYASYHYARFVWSFDLLPDHKVKITQVLMPSQPIDMSLKASVDTAMVLLGLNMTGMYFNPSMASANTFGCTGINYWEHLFVYWGGPFLGVILALQLNSKCKIRRG